MTTSNSPPISGQIGPTAAYVEAVQFAVDSHVDRHTKQPEVRKGTSTPYLSHLLAVSAIVWEAGGDEVMAIAGLLHDTLEDTETTTVDLADKFGDEVASMVKACSDGLEDGVQRGPRDASDWRDRKERYIAHLKEERDTRVLIVTAADKLHNARSVVADAESGTDVWSRFKGRVNGTLWYYDEVLSALRHGFEESATEPPASEPGYAWESVLRQLEQAVRRMKVLAPTLG